MKRLNPIISWEKEENICKIKNNKEDKKKKSLIKT